MAIARRAETVTAQFMIISRIAGREEQSVLKRSPTYGNPIRFLLRSTGRVTPDLCDRVYASHSYVNAGKTRKRREQ
jgi:hypothetical protein